MTNKLTPEQARLNMANYRSRQRDRGFCLLNKWTNKKIREDVYELIDRINFDFKRGETSFLKMMLNVLRAANGTEIHARRVHGKWDFHVIEPEEKQAANR